MNSELRVLMRLPDTDSEFWRTRLVVCRKHSLKSMFKARFSLKNCCSDDVPFSVQHKCETTAHMLGMAPYMSLPLCGFQTQFRNFMKIRWDHKLAPKLFIISHQVHHDSVLTRLWFSVVAASAIASSSRLILIWTRDLVLFRITI